MVVCESVKSSQSSDNHTRRTLIYVTRRYTQQTIWSITLFFLAWYRNSLLTSASATCNAEASMTSKSDPNSQLSTEQSSTPPSRPSPYDQLAFPSDRNEALAMILHGDRQRFLEDTTNALPALFALCASAVHHLMHTSPRPDDEVKVKWWALEVFFAGFMKYRDACKGKGSTTLDAAFGINGGGQGKEPKIKTDFRLRRDREIAIAIATNDAPADSVETRIAAAGSNYGIGAETVWRSWSTHGDKANDIVERFRHHLPKS
jgi:hypothetical protein